MFSNQNKMIDFMLLWLNKLLNIVRLERNCSWGISFIDKMADLLSWPLLLSTVLASGSCPYLWSCLRRSLIPGNTPPLGPPPRTHPTGDPFLDLPPTTFTPSSPYLCTHLSRMPARPLLLLFLRLTLSPWSPPGFPASEASSLVFLPFPSHVP